jgi:hypothetical protein
MAQNRSPGRALQKWRRQFQNWIKQPAERLIGRLFENANYLRTWAITGAA